MEQTLARNQVSSLIQELSCRPELKHDSNIITLTSNELADILLKVSSDLRKGLPLDELLEKTVTLLGKAGIAERVLLFQINSENTKSSLTHYWSSSYVPRFDPIGFQIDLRDAPLFKTFHLSNSNTIQIQDFAKYLSLPHYIFRNKLKAFLIKLKSKSLLISIGSTDKIKLALNLQFCTRDVIWSNETEKALQSIVDQLAVAIEQHADKKKKETLQNNIIELQNNAIKEQEELLKQFASDVHDLPCSIIPNLKQAIRNKDFKESEKLVDELHNNLRLLINEYVLPDINLLGFTGTIFQFINGFRKGFKGKVRLEIPDDEINIPQKKAIELFKVIKEWFCNIEKHSEASEINFQLRIVNECYLSINISDNGKGFDVNNIKNLGYGILNIRRRLTEINSKFEIKSVINKGSTLRVQLCLT